MYKQEAPGGSALGTLYFSGHNRDNNSNCYEDGHDLLAGPRSLVHLVWSLSNGPRI
jgi:hypothetical protein